MTNWFWQIMVNNRRSHVGSSVLEWFGYEGLERTQKRKFIEMLRRNTIPFQELTISDKEVNEYPTIVSEMNGSTNKGGLNLTKWLIMEPRDIKRAILKLNTKTGDIIKNYYIRMEELVRLYAQYTYMFQKLEKEKMSRELLDLQTMMEDMKLERSQDRKILIRQENMIAESHNMLRSMGVEIKDIKFQNDELLDQNNELIENLEDVQNEMKDVKRKVVQVQAKLDISVEDRAPQPDKDRRRERFLLLKRNDEEFPYYTIRAQDINAKKALKRQRDKYPSVQILLDLPCHPNTKTFFVRIKDDLRTKGVVFNLCEINIEESNVTEEDLIKEMMKINDEKRDI